MTEPKPPTPTPPPTTRSQAERVLEKFGGARRLSKVLAILGRSKDPASMYKWTYSRDKGGTGGIIPTSAWADILAAARFDGVMITPEDTDPRAHKIKVVRPYRRLHPKFHRDKKPEEVK